GNVRLLDRLQRRRHTGLAQILLRQDVASNLAPVGGNLDSFGCENNRSVGVADLANRTAERDGFVGVLTFCRKAARDMHTSPASCQDRAGDTPCSALARSENARYSKEVNAATHMVGGGAESH